MCGAVGAAHRRLPWHPPTLTILCSLYALNSATPDMTTPSPTPLIKVKLSPRNNTAASTM